jgi:hypothetical protein
MGVTYTQGTDPLWLEPVELSERLAKVIRGAMPWLATLSEEDASQSEDEGTWSVKQVVGHLTDSAVNNLGRIVRMQRDTDQYLPGYDQMEWVRAQHYSERNWAEVLGLWFALNEHIVWTIAHLKKSSLANRGEVAGSPITLGFLIEDYVAHMQHHLRAMKGWAEPGLG